MLVTDALDIRLDEDGDLFIGQRGPEVVSGPAGVAQLCKIAVRLVLGEWFVNQAKGIDWFTLLQNKRFNVDDVASQIRTQLLQVPTVTSVLAISVSPPDASRRVQASATVRSEFGDVTVDATVGGN